MPSFLSPADYCHGEGSPGGVTSINKIPVLGPTTTATRALNADEAICQLNGSQLWAVDKHGRSRLVDNQGANYLYARGNRWGAQLDVDGVATFRTGVNGSITPVELPIIGVGWGGQLMTKANPGAGLIVGGIHLSNGVVEDQQASEDGKVLWREGFTVRAHGMTAPRRMPPEFYWMAHATVLGEEWIAYQDGWRVVARKFDDETSGYILPTSGVYGLEIIADGELLRFVWGIRSGEQPGDIEEHVISVHQPRVPLLPANGGGDPIDVDPIDPDKPEEPKPDMELEKLLTPRIDIVQAVHRDYPNLDAGDTVDQVIHRLNREYKTDVFGRKLKNDGHTLNDDVVTILLDKNDRGKKKLIDVLGSGNPANAQWDVRPSSEEPGNGTWTPAATPDRDGQDGADPGDENDAKKPHAYVAGDHDGGTCDLCGQPRSAAIHQGVIEPPKPPSGVGLVAEVQKLIAAAVAPMSAKIAALEARPSGGGVAGDVVKYGDHIALRFKSGGHLLTRDGDRNNLIHADDRDSAGSWETQTIERGEQ